MNNRLPPVSVDASGGWTTVSAFPNIAFEDPTFLTHGPGTNILYVCGRQGMIWCFPNDPSVSNKTVFLNLTNRTQGYDDCGLTAMAFHPEFGRPGSTNRGFFYVWYQYSPSPINTSPNRPNSSTPSYNRLSRFTVPDGSWVADPNSELVLINQYDENLWHNGGGMFFGEDGFLYLTNGDEGGGDDAYGNSQKINKGLFSGVLRIDVDSNPDRSHPIRRQPQSGSPPPAGWPGSYTTNYYIPNDNPFVNSDGSVLEEFYAIGFRSPFRMSYDAITKSIWLADVGDSAREEVDIVIKGGNYQWAYGEGLNFSGPQGKPPTIIGTEVPPIYDYPHTSGNSCIIGGYIYRGLQFAADLGSQYIFGDNFSGRIWSMAYDGSNAPVVTYLCNMPPGLNYQGLSSFGLDERNEIYMCQMGASGHIYKLARTGANYAQPPPLLSQAGVFTNAASLAATSGLLPYNVNSPLWSDAAIKQRWIAVPNDGSPYTNVEQVGFAPTGEWTFPIGTVFVKHFELPVDDTNPDIRKRLETRLLIRGTNGNFYGLTYKWRADNSDADLLTNSLSEDLVIATAAGTRTQTWYYPGRQDCLICHNPNANYVLGVKTRQLNGNYTYSTGVSDNQLRTWNHLGLFNPAIDEAGLTNYVTLVHVTNTTASLETRVRSYLDANCSQCHRPNSGIQAYWDARFDTPLASQGITNGAVVADLGISGATVVAPGDLSKSVLYLRLNTNGSSKMPPLARNTIDGNAVATLAAWINSLAAGVTNVPPGISAQPQSLIVNKGAGATFTVTATGTAPFSYQWQKDFAAIVGATSSAYSIAGVQASDAGSYSVVITNVAGSIVSSNATLTVNIPPSITVQPQSLVVNQGANAAFSVSASGTPPLGYQWRKNSVVIPGATGTSCSFSNVQAGAAGSYSVVITNIAGSVTSSNASLIVTIPPLISVQPQNVTINLGGNATFAVTASGTSPLRYQWQHNAMDIAGATNGSFTCFNVQPSDAGNYAVVITNTAGSAMSSNAVLTVNVPPSITAQPNNLTLNAGENATFSAAASGTAPLLYQWQYNNTNIPGASNLFLLLTNIQTANAGSYALVVSNLAGTARSSNASLVVLPVAIPSSGGLVNWWPGDGDSRDIQGTNNGTLKNGTTFANGIVGQAFSFDGKTNMVSVGIILASIVNTFTVEFWAKPMASRTSTAEANTGVTGITGQRYAIFPRHGASSFGAGHVGAGVSVGTNGVSVFEHTDSYLGSPLVLNIPITNWTHVALVYQNRQPSIYINGVLKRTGLTSTYIVHPSGDMGGPYGFYSGSLDEIGIYNRALSASEIQSIFNTGSAGLYKGLEFTDISQPTGGKIQMSLKAKTGGKLRIDISTNLLDWTLMAILANTNGAITFTDSSSNAPMRFYRSVILP